MTVENEEVVKKVIKDTCKLEEAKSLVEEYLKDPHCNITEKLGFDSLLFVELIVGLEDELDFEFDMNNLDINKLKYYDELLMEIDDCIGK